MDLNGGTNCEFWPTWKVVYTISLFHPVLSCETPVVGRQISSICYGSEINLTMKKCQFPKIERFYFSSNLNAFLMQNVHLYESIQELSYLCVFFSFFKLVVRRNSGSIPIHFLYHLLLLS